VQQWLQRLVAFWRTGRGLFEHTAKKGQLDASTVQEVLAACQQGLLETAAGTGNRGELAGFWAPRLERHAIAEIENILGKGQEALQYQTNPSLVLDWTALQIWQRLQPGAADRGTGNGPTQGKPRQ
jgi:hypothetical protein